MSNKLYITTALIALNLLVSIPASQVTTARPTLLSHKSADQNKISAAQSKPKIAGDYKITLREDGGFAARHNVYDATTVTMSAPARAKLDDLVLKSGLLKVKGTEKHNRVAADAISYRFEFTTEKSPSHTAEFDDSTIDRDYRELADFIRKQAGK